MELVDPKLGSNFNKGEALRMIKIALHCTNVSPAARPNMSSVVSMLEGKQAVEDIVSGPGISEEARNAAWTHLLADIPTTGSSTSVSDLYPINVSQYLDTRN